MPRPPPSAVKRWYGPEKPKRRAPSSIKRSRSIPITRKPCTAAACSVRANSNTACDRRFHRGEWPDAAAGRTFAGPRGELPRAGQDQGSRRRSRRGGAGRSAERRDLNRGLAYERLGDKAKAAGSYSRAINLRPRDETARNGFARVGGKPGQNYDAF